MKIVEQFRTVEGKKLTGLVLTTMIINHSKDYLYIPSFTTERIHFYELKDTTWKEVDIYLKEYTDSIHESLKRSPHNLLQKKFESFRQALENNEIAQYFNRITNKRFYENSNFFEKYCKNNNINHLNVSLTSPIFLNPNDTLHSYFFLPIDYLSSTGKKYKISFNTGKEDKFENIQKKALVLNPLPNFIYNYKLYSSDRLTSNILFYPSK